MPPKSQSRFWRTLRLVWRGCRIAALLLVLALLVGLIYLNRSGLPEFARRPLLEKLRARGFDFEMSRLRLRFYRGLVAENVKFDWAETPSGCRLTARMVEVKLNYRALLRGRLHVTAVVLDQGRFVWPIAQTNAPSRELLVENIRADLRLPPGDEWALDQFQASFAGVDFTLSGAVTNASAIRDWPLLRGQPPAGATQRRLQRFADTLEHIHFTTHPELRLTIGGDARDLRSFTAHLTLNAPDADTPWGKIARAAFTARMLPATAGDQLHAELSLQAHDAQTPWAGVADLDLAVHLVSSADSTNLVDAEVTAKAARVATKWASATNAQFNAHWLHSLTNAIPLSGHGELRAASAASRWINGRSLWAAATLATQPNPPPADASWAWWTNLHPYQLDWTCELSQLRTENLDADKFLCGGRWRAPELTVTNLHASFPDGALAARAQLDVATREARFELASNFDVKKLSPLLTAKARHWLGKYSWQQPPVLAGGGAVVLPAWTNPHWFGNWPGEVAPTLWLAGEFAITNGAYLGVPADWARSHFTYSNGVWHLPDLAAGRPEGRLQLVHIANDRTKDYYWRVHSTIDLRALRPLLTAEQQRGLGLVEFSQPPVIDGELWGRWHEYDRVGFQGRVSLTNFSFRGETAGHFESALRYTNQVLECFDPRLLRGTQSLTAAGITVDFKSQRIHFTNGLSTAEPMVVARAIGPQPARTLEPFRFAQPPTVRVSGYAPLHGSSDADLTFNVVRGSEFQWWKFKVPQIAGKARWLGETLTLTNVQAAFYGGTAAGFAHFDFTPERGTDFGFTLGLTNVSLPRLRSDLSPHTNRLEGALGGWLAIARANSDDPRSWTGTGRARLRDGFLWEIPIFGVLSKPLDTIMPGVGNSRFSEASARFGITNGVIAWDKLEMRAPTMRLQYDGTVDFEGHVDMRVEAEPLRDAPLFGRILSYALWPVTKLFQYRITGTLEKPKSEPVYVPKLLLLPLRPFRTLEDLFTPDSEGTNAPPVFKEVPE